MRNGCALSGVPLTRIDGHASASRWILAATTHGLDMVVNLHTDPSSNPGSNNHDIVQEWGEQSFPASDPPANW
ncbi:hypothetical protein ACQP04_23380 [Pseudonocardia halophobica]|uniref:hypothetical protein n=1 Tax=Pseudonocardia halophobica TaxID=29401 RepID=UPI003D8D5881